MPEVADVEAREVVAIPGLLLDPERHEGRPEGTVREARRVERLRALEAVGCEEVSVVRRHAERVVAGSHRAHERLCAVPELGRALVEAPALLMGVAHDLRQRAARVGVARHRQERGGADIVLHFRYEIVAGEAEEVHRHLAADQLHVGLDAGAAKLLDAGDALVVDRLLHERGGHRLEPRHNGLHRVRNVPVDGLEPLRAEGHLHRHAGVAERAHLQVADVLSQQPEAVEGEEHRDVPAERGGGAGEDEGRVGPVEGALGGDDGHRGRLLLAQLGELFRQQGLEALVDQAFQRGFVRLCGHVGSPWNLVLPGSMRDQIPLCTRSIRSCCVAA